MYVYFTKIVLESYRMEIIKFTKKDEMNDGDFNREM